MHIHVREYIYICMYLDDMYMYMLYTSTQYVVQYHNPQTMLQLNTWSIITGTDRNLQLTGLLTKQSGRHRGWAVPVASETTQEPYRQMR